MKVDEDQPATPLQHSIRGDGGVDTAGDEGYDSAAGSHRETAGTLNSIKAEECIPRQNFYGNGQFRIRKIHASSGSFFHRRSELAIDFRRCQWKAFVAALGFNPKG